MLFNVNTMLLVLNKILSMRFTNDFVEKKYLVLILLFILFYSNPIKKDSNPMVFIQGIL